jgi:hypothetical protein
MCVRDGVPAGSVAVLLNPAHKHAEFVLPIDRREDDLLAQVDGICTLDEIARRVAGKTPLPGVRDFFQKLWWNDQVVFDAARSRF